MNIVPIHFAPHSNDHLPLCGERPALIGGDNKLLIGTPSRDHTTCFRCIDQYEERAVTLAQAEALAREKALFDALEDQLAFDSGKRVTLHAMHHVLANLPWWALSRRITMHRAIRKMESLTLEDLTKSNLPR